MTPTLSPGVRVEHANPVHRYGAGELLEIVPSSIRPPSKARVHFDGERCPRLVWLDDLTAALIPMPGSPATLRIIYPVERAGEPMGAA